MIQGEKCRFLSLTGPIAAISMGTKKPCEIKGVPIVPIVPKEIRSIRTTGAKTANERGSNPINVMLYIPLLLYLSAPSNLEKLRGQGVNGDSVDSKGKNRPSRIGLYGDSRDKKPVFSLNQPKKRGICDYRALKNPA